MPEGHTIHRLARDLSEMCDHSLRAVSPQGRFAEGARQVDGALLEHIEPFGKHLLLAFDTGSTIHVHLGMRGKWLRYEDPMAAPLSQVRLRLAQRLVAWDLIAPSRCELLDQDGVRRVLASLGPDPLRPETDAASVIARLAADPRPIATVLLDQRVLAGVGNVFRNEALHAIGVPPTRPSRTLAPDELERLWSVLQTMMSRAVDDGRIVTVDAEDRLAVPESVARRVYKQERCRDCGAAVVVSTVGGRTAYHCPVEQAG